jgi:hypothetical protein
MVKSSLHDPNRGLRMKVLDSLTDDVRHVQTLLQAHFVVTRAARVLLKCDQCHADITGLLDETDPKTTRVPLEVVCHCGCIWPLTTDEAHALVRQLGNVRDELAWALAIVGAKPLPPEKPEPPEVLFTAPEVQDE